MSNAATQRASGLDEVDGQVALCRFPSLLEYCNIKMENTFLGFLIQLNRFVFSDLSSDAEPMLSSEPEPSAFANKDVTTSSSPQDIEKRLSIISLGQVNTQLHLTVDL